MTLLAQNVSTNCRRTATSGKSCTALEEGMGEETEARSPFVAANVKEKTGVVSSRQTKMIPAPRVHELRWGNRAQLVDALAAFDSFGPDVVLA